MAAPPLKRSQVAREDTWDLTLMYATDEEWHLRFTEACDLPREASRFRGTLGTSPKTLAEALKHILEAFRTVERLYVYAHLRQDQDLSDSTAVEMYEKAASLNSSLAAETSYMAPEILAVEPSTMAFWLETPDVKPYAIWLEDILRAGPHTLNASEEALLARASEVSRCFSGASGKLTNVEMPARLPEIETDDGRTLKLTNSNFIRILTEGTGNVRKSAFQGYYNELSGNVATLAALLEGQVKAHVFRARARSFPSALSASLFNDRVSTGVYDSLITAVRGNLPTLHRYYDLKKRVLNLPSLGMQDLYTPIAGEGGRPYTFEEAVQLTLDAVRPLGTQYVETLSRGIENRWVDRYENSGKRSGAYSSGCYDSPPYMLLNFTGTLDSVFTLAHEAGHSMHSHYSRKTRSYQDSDYPIILAEVASITNEILLFEHLSGKLSDRSELVGMLDHLVNSFRSTLFRQTMFAEFELLIHRHVEEGGILTPDFLNEQYFALVRAYHGDSFAWDDSDRLIATEWARVPHFYYNFYVYKYATGMAAAVAATEAVLGGKANAYSAFLAGGRSRPPLEQLLGIDVDLESPGPVNSAAARFARTTDLLEEALGQKG
jgi:oligoendopeptidase F